MSRSGSWILAAVSGTTCLALVALRLAPAGRSQDRPAGVEPCAAGLAAGSPSGPRVSLVSDALPTGPLRTSQELRAVVEFCRSASEQQASELQSAALHAVDPAVAGNALRALGRLGRVDDVAELAQLLQDPRPRVRQEAVVALGRSGDDSAVERLQPLIREEDATLRRLAVRALGELGGDRARSLVEGVARDPQASETDRAFARAALAAQSPPLSGARGAPADRRTHPRESGR